METVSFVRRKFNSMLGIATVSMAVNFIVMLAGSAVAGNLLGGEGLAGINVCTPVFAVASFIGSLVSVGAGVAFSRAMGEGDELRAAETWSVAFCMAVAAGSAIFLAMFFGGEAYFDFNCVTGMIRAEAVSYWRWQAVAMGLTPPMLLMMAMVYADGDGVVAMVAGGCYVLGTIGFSVLFTTLSGHAGGISGGTALTMALVLVVSSLHFLRHGNHLKFKRGFPREAARAIVAGSLPDATIYLCWGLLVLAINRFTVAIFGEELLAVVALGVSVVEFSIVFDGVGEALIPLSGMYMGEGNRPALRELANHSALVAAGEGVVAGIALYTFAPTIAAVYGFRGDAAALLPQATATIRALAVAMPFMGLLMMMNTFYLVVGHAGLAVEVTVLKDLVFPCACSLVLGRVLGFAGMWEGVVVGYALAAAATLAFVRVRHGRKAWPWLVLPDEASGDFAIRLGPRALVAVRDRVESFLVERGVEDVVVKRVMLTVEESGIAAMEKNARSPLMECFVSLGKPGFVRLVVRDDGVEMATPFRYYSENRYLNILNCNRSEHWFKI